MRKKLTEKHTAFLRSNAQTHEATLRDAEFSADHPALHAGYKKAPCLNGRGSSFGREKHRPDKNEAARLILPGKNPKTQRDSQSGRLLLSRRGFSTKAEPDLQDFF
jgi:hypothetical protein